MILIQGTLFSLSERKTNEKSYILKRISKGIQIRTCISNIQIKKV